ncbi:SgcJ/EcaC family oxidoreductase [Sphingomonas sp. PP-F2F-G114-C0414]|uniref:YybH family protein n=1 Tax=Sphingomonas sp. PP-F2F-G114-C0414 TaxID=2135662 RepID=UPI00217E464D|nr:SgcJ/EcaC family oxidoreductase [Sphingomonas sp. PP-F2F-G114-C0414]
MMRALLVPAVMMSAAAAPAQVPAETAIRETMAASAAGWNAGDLARFMAVYADDAVFVTPKGLLRGKTAIAAKYQPSFRGVGNTRGALSFAFLEMRGIDPRHAMLFARWTLTGASTVESGMTTLVFERRGTAWQIIADHSS